LIEGLSGTKDGAENSFGSILTRVLFKKTFESSGFLEFEIRQREFFLRNQRRKFFLQNQKTVLTNSNKLGTFILRF